MQKHVGIRNFFVDAKNTQKHYSLCVYFKQNMHFTHMAGILRCFMSFRLRCKRMRFYVVFGGTCILSEITQKHVHLYTILQNVNDNLIQFVTICYVWVSCWLGAVSWAGWVGLASAPLRASVGSAGQFLLLFVVGALPLGAFLHAHFPGILSRGAFLHAHLPLSPFPGDNPP